jgi:para-nitrobenzyl esterase
VRGVTENGTAVFRGIPYAEPPVGKLRFKPPVERARWEGVRDASKFGEIVPQSDKSWLDMASLPKDVPFGDDCLSLNVWTPALGSAALPVYVWIHGGGFRHGSGAAVGFNADSFARQGVILVTINYRLGAAGFAMVSDEGGLNNFGLQDQLMALRWVQDNIAAFGGDPQQVTVGGESAGAFSIGQHLAIPAADSLFRRAIMESGGAHLHGSAATAEAICAELFAVLGVRHGDEDAIAGITSTQLVAAQHTVDEKMGELLLTTAGTPNLLSLAFRYVGFVPAYHTDLLPDRALNSITTERASKVDLMIGSNTDESRAFIPTREVEEYMLPHAEMVGDLAFAPLGRTGAAVLESYRANRAAADLVEMVVPFNTDLIFRIPSIRLAETIAHHNPNTYMFRFGWQGRYGAIHSLGLGFMFNFFDVDQVILDGLGADNPPLELGVTMNGSLANFIKTGSPQHANLPEWPVYEPTRRATMEFNTESYVSDDPDSFERQLWDGVDY